MIRTLALLMLLSAAARRLPSIRWVGGHRSASGRTNPDGPRIPRREWRAGDAGGARARQADPARARPAQLPQHLRRDAVRAWRRRSRRRTFKPGRDYEIVAFGIDPKEGPAEAAARSPRSARPPDAVRSGGVHAVTGSAADDRARDAGARLSLRLGRAASANSRMSPPRAC